MVQLNPLKWGKKKNKLKVEKKMGSQGGSKTRYQTKKAKPLLEKEQILELKVEWVVRNLVIAEELQHLQ